MIDRFKVRGRAAAKEPALTAFNWGLLTLAVGSAGFALAAINHYLASRAERDNPPKGHFLDIAGERLHYMDTGEGPAVVLLHGNGSMLEDFLCSGLVDQLSAAHRVIVFDRPGFGYSPARHQHDPDAQAEILEKALAQLGVEEATIVGHSWGTLVAIALSHSSQVRIRGLVLASGYYFPGARLELLAGSLAAIPILGRLLAHTLLPLMAGANWDATVRTLFAPAPARTFANFPKELVFRPSQLRASARETALLNPSAAGILEKCRAMSVPVIFLAGAGDRVVGPDHSIRLQRRLLGSEIEIIPLQGHMLHHTAAQRVISAVERLVTSPAG